MKFKQVFIGAALPVLLVSCGGGSSDDKADLSQNSGVIFSVNGVRDVTRVEVTRLELTVDNSGSTLEQCGSTEDEVTTPFYDNYAAITQAGQDDYCDQSRFTVTPQLTFRVSYLNNEYDAIPFSYTGFGFSIRIYEYDESGDLLGEEVWNTDIAQNTANRFNGLADFVPSAQVTTTLGPAETFPHQDQGTFRSFVFFGDRNFEDSDINSDAFFPDLETVQLLGDLNLCADRVLDENDNDVQDKPICQGLPVAAGTYIALINFNFNGMDETREVIINILPPVEPAT